MAGTTQKKTQEARAKKQTKKVKATTVNVVVKTQAVAVNSKTKRTPRRKTEAAPAPSREPLREAVPVLYASVFNTSPTPVIARQPVYDFPMQYEPVKGPAVDVQRVETLTSPIIAKPTADGITDMPTAVNQETQVPLLEPMTKKKLFEYASQNGISGVTMKQNKPEMIAKIRNFQA